MLVHRVPMILSDWEIGIGSFGLLARWMFLDI